MVAASGLVFSLVSLIYNEKYLVIGLTTFVYGVVSNFIDVFYWYWFDEKNESKSNILIFIIHGVLILIWFVVEYKIVTHLI